MKKLLFLATLIAMPLVATQESDNLVKGMELVKKQKAEWMNYAKDMHSAKFDLIRNEHNKMFDRKINTIRKFANNSITEYDAAALADLIEQHKEAMAAWKKWSDTYHEKAKTLHENHAKELAKLESSVYPDEVVEVDELVLE